MATLEDLIEGKQKASIIEAKMTLIIRCFKYFIAGTIEDVTLTSEQKQMLRASALAAYTALPDDLNAFRTWAYDLYQELTQ